MDIKKELMVGIIGSLVIIGITLFFINQYNVFQNKLPKNNSNIKIVNETNTTSTSSANKLSYTKDEVSKHNQQTDCWLIINNSVYDSTDYLSSHPGGAETIISFCGTDATQAFTNKDGEEPHSDKAYQDLIPLKIGDLN